MRHSSRLLAACASAAGVVGACSVGAERDVHVMNDEAVPFDLLKRNAPTLVPQARTPVTETVALCFIRDGGLVVSSRIVDSPVTLPDVVAALREVPASIDARTAVGPTPLVNSVRLEGGVVRVDFSPSLAALGGEDQMLAVAQLVCTLTARPGIGQVSFTLDGAPIDVPRGDGSLTADPVSRDDYTQLLL